MGRVRHGLAIGFLVFALAGSSLLGVGLGCSVEDGSIEVLGPGSPDGASANNDGSTSTQDDGGARDARVIETDSGSRPFDAACGNTFSSAASLNGFKSTHAKTIDGIDDDWGCEAPFDLTGANATQKHSNSPDGGYDMSGACKIEWAPIAVYVFCDVVDPTAGDGTSSNLTANDAVEIYISGTPIASRAGNYGSFDHQYVVDWRGNTTEYANAAQLGGPPSGFTAAVTAHSGGYSIEAAIMDTALLSGSSLGDSMTLGFDFAVDNGAGQLEAIVWAQGTHAGCASCTITSCCCQGDNGPETMDYAYCDALAFGSLTLNP